jgi:GNAT superfamily N-acetyltransferase
VDAPCKTDGVHVEEIDPFDDEAFSAWFKPYHASELLTWPDDSGWAEHELRAIYRDSPDSEFVLAVIRGDTDSVVACLDVSLPIKENLHLGYLGVAVAPLHRHQGAGRGLLHHAEGIARERGRETVIAHTERALSGDLRDERFAAAAGYTAGVRMAARELFLPADADLLDRLEVEAAAHASNYKVVTWSRSCPDEYVPDRVGLSRTMSTDAPHSEAERDAEEWDAGRLRDWERIVVEMDRVLLASGAIEASTGRLVGFSELSVSLTSPKFAYQFDTVVAPTHRGHRLGLLLKLATLQQLTEISPHTERVITNNAIINEPMIRVNEAMGFRLRTNRTSWQKTLS